MEREMDMVERVARAISAQLEDYGFEAYEVWEGQCDLGWIHNIAIKAIEAMRDPSHDMMQAIFEAMFEEKYDGTTAPMIGAGWEAGIDAAIKEHEGSGR